MEMESSRQVCGSGAKLRALLGLSVEAATEEANHYGTHPEDAILIQVTGQSRRILDLTHPDVIQRVFEENVENHEVVSWSYYSMLEELIERGNGGIVTDYIGLRAKRNGYQGILSFSARVLKDLQLFRMDRDLEGYTYRTYFWELRRNSKNLNVVFFSGAEVINGIQTIRIGDERPLDNPYFGTGPDKIWAMFPDHNEYYQLEQDRFLLTKPKYLDPPD
jgi:hypothetical protein